MAERSILVKRQPAVSPFFCLLHSFCPLTHLSLSYSFSLPQSLPLSQPHHWVQVCLTFPIVCKAVFAHGGKCWVSVNKWIKEYGLDLLNLESDMRWLLLWFGAIQINTDWLIDWLIDWLNEWLKLIGSHHLVVLAMEPQNLSTLCHVHFQTWIRKIWASLWAAVAQRVFFFFSCLWSWLVLWPFPISGFKVFGRIRK